MNEWMNEEKGRNWEIQGGNEQLYKGRIEIRTEETIE